MVEIDIPLDIELDEAEKPKKKRRWGKVFLTIFSILFIVAVILGVTMGSITHYQCKTKCENAGTVTWIKIQNGGWDLNDTCICFMGENNFNLVAKKSIS